MFALVNELDVSTSRAAKLVLKRGTQYESLFRLQALSPNTQRPPFTSLPSGIVFTIVTIYIYTPSKSFFILTPPNFITHPSFLPGLLESTTIKKYSQTYKHLPTKLPSPIYHNAMPPRPRRSLTNGHLRPNGLCIHIITYGKSRGKPAIPLPTLFALDCLNTEPPPAAIRERYTGADPELADLYFSNPLHEKLFREVLDRLEVRILNGPFLSGGCAAVVVNCMSGTYVTSISPFLKFGTFFSKISPFVSDQGNLLTTNIFTGKHRSVAMAERLAKELAQWDRVTVQLEHLDTDVETRMTREPRIEAGTHK